MGSADAESSRAVLDIFADPPREYSSGPLWVWNDMLTEEQVLATLRDLAAQEVKQVFVHPRPGLMTPYLSEDWFKLWKAALREAETLDMNVWIYDENSYPSGFAGGFVPEAMPESHGIGLFLNALPKPPTWDDKTIAVFRLNGESLENVSETVRAGTELPEGAYIVATVNESKSSPWFGGKYYVDLLRPGVTEKFLDITLGAYKREIGDELGKRVPGSFTDEPHLAPAGGFHWTTDLPDVMQERYGYSILDTLPSLSQRVGDWRAVRHDYYQTLLHLFIERWAKPYHDYCAENDLEFTGHYWEHEWPNCKQAPDNMAMYAWHQRPAIDTLFNEYNEGPHAQFGNVRAVLELASAANQTGVRRTLCEAYGGAGWDLRFEDMKRIGDWLFVLGVNTLNEHLSYITMRGARKYDYPQSFSYHEPWWNSYHVMAKYFTRLSAALSHGEPVAETLLIEPTTTVWMYQTDEDREVRESIGIEFQELVTNLAKAQVEFDLGSEDILARHGAVEGDKLRIGARTYGRVILAPRTESLDAKTVELLDAFVKAKGTLVSIGDAQLQYVDGRPSDKATALIAGATRMTSGQFIEQWSNDRERLPRVTIDPASTNAIVYHMRRRFDDGDLVFLVNTRNDATAKGSIAAGASYVQRWNLESGAAEPYPHTNFEGTASVAFDLPPCGSLLLFLNKSKGESAAQESLRRESIEPMEEPKIARVAPNVLTLDYLDLSIGEKSYPKQYMYAAARLAFQSVGFQENPWDHAVQFNDELIREDLPKESGFEATYRFTIDGPIPGAIHAVVERPDLYLITCNGTPIRATPGEWWLDRAFGKIDITSTIRNGENSITLKAWPMNMFHEIAAVYILGDFALKPAASGHVIVPPASFAHGPWNQQGCPFYAHGVSYAQRFNIPELNGRYLVELPKWHGSVAEVIVNGRRAGHIAWKPAECDVTPFLTAGENFIEVTVIGTLKNTLGPYFGEMRLGFASPQSFRSAPEGGPPEGSAYKSVEYGLMEPFRLVALRR